MTAEAALREAFQHLDSYMRAAFVNGIEQETPPAVAQAYVVLRRALRAGSAGGVRAAPLLKEAKEPVLDRWFVEETPSPTAGKGFIAVDGPLPRVDAERLAAEKRSARPDASITVWQHPKDFAQSAKESPV